MSNFSEQFAKRTEQLQTTTRRLAAFGMFVTVVWGAALIGAGAFCCWMLYSVAMKQGWL